jgi:hypothetical protein
MMNSNSSKTKAGHSDDWPFSTGTPRKSFPLYRTLFLFSIRLAYFYNIIPSTTHLRDSMTA